MSYQHHWSFIITSTHTSFTKRFHTLNPNTPPKLQTLLHSDTTHDTSTTPQNTATMSDDDDFMQASDDEKYDLYLNCFAEQVTD